MLADIFGDLMLTFCFIIFSPWMSIFDSVHLPNLISVHLQFSFFFFFNFIYLFLAVLGLCFCARAFSSCGKWGPLFIAVRGPLFIVMRGLPTTAASPAAEHRLQTRRLSNCGSRAQSLRGTWDPPRPGPEPGSPALAGGLSTTAPPGKPPSILFLILNLGSNTVAGLMCPQSLS